MIELPSYNGKSEQQISNPVGEYTFYPFWTLEDTARRCIAGEGKISTDVKVTLYPASGAFIDTPLWSYTGYVETDCSIAVEPRPATYIAEACGYTDDRIQVPIQSGIHNHTISWDGNVATITYIPMPVHEIIGGPFTVTITEDPCVNEPVPDPVQTEICGVDNDLVEIGDDVEGVLYDTSDGWIDNTYDVRISTRPGWVLPEDQQTEFALVDEGDCEIEDLTAPAHIEVCGVNNDTVHVPEGIENVTITTSGEMSVDGTVTITYVPDEHYMLPKGIEPEYTFGARRLPGHSQRPGSPGGGVWSGQ